MKPFLKWAGNKYKILPKIMQVLPHGKRLIEPFVGSGAVFLNSEYKKYLLADSNKDLINVYWCLKREKQDFIKYCKSFFKVSLNCYDKYLELRDVFNNTNDKRLKSALFIYLNRHAYNGLCRYNSLGKFNVSFGKYEQPYFPEEEMRFFAAKVQHAKLVYADFLETMQQAEQGDVIYCDPPYVPLSKTANFVSYGSNKFDATAQHALANIAKQLSTQGVTVIISNHDTALVNKMYRGAAIARFNVQRFISCKGHARTKVGEILAVFKSTV